MFQLLSLVVEGLIRFFTETVGRNQDDARRAARGLKLLYERLNECHVAYRRVASTQPPFDRTSTLWKAYVQSVEDLVKTAVDQRTALEIHAPHVYRALTGYILTEARALARPDDTEVVREIMRQLAYDIELGELPSFEETREKLAHFIKKTASYGDLL